MDAIAEALSNTQSSILDALPVGVVFVSQEGMVTYGNHASQQILHHTLLGSVWRDIVKNMFTHKEDDGHEVSTIHGKYVHVSIAPMPAETEHSAGGQLIVLVDLTASRIYERLKTDIKHSVHLKKTLILESQKNNSKEKSRPVPVAESSSSLAIYALAERIADSDMTVMITGESGTGKEVIARFIHEHSKRYGKPFIAINCAAIPEQMLEATLFGYEKGSFTGAYKSTPGKFELANEGTLLLDEVSEMSLPLQAKLLRVIQEREVERIGGNQPISLNVRLLATSNRILLDEVKKGRFREDLYYRLNVFPLYLTPLRERKEDILPLARYLIVKYWQDKIHYPTISEEASAKLFEYAWPGNVRELENVIQRALLMQENGTINVSDLSLLETCFDNDVEDDALYKQIFTELNGQDKSRLEVAKLLGMSERTLRYKLAKMRTLGYAV